jgi:hypothetical protein
MLLLACAVVCITVAPFIWLIIHLIQLVFSAGTIFFSHKKSANSVFQQAYNSSLTAPAYASLRVFCGQGGRIPVVTPLIGLHNYHFISTQT